MMRSLEKSRPQWSRVISALLLVLQAVALIALPLTDARAEARSVSAAVHVEDTTSPACVPTHEHSACVVCRALRALGPTATPLPFLPLAVRQHAPVTNRNIDAELGAVAASIRPRAPPAR